MWYTDLLDHCKAKKTRVVARLTTTYGHIVYGVNLESSCHSLSICAERASIINAVTQLGNRMKIKRIEVYAEREGVPIDIVPCGGCRQLISEFATKETEVCGKKIHIWMPDPYL